MQALARLGLLVGAIAMSTFATVKPTDAATTDCFTFWFQTCTTEGSTIYCQAYDCPHVCTCRMSGDGLRWRCGVDPSYGICD